MHPNKWRQMHIRSLGLMGSYILLAPSINWICGYVVHSCGSPQLRRTNVFVPNKFFFRHDINFFRPTDYMGERLYTLRISPDIRHVISPSPGARHPSPVTRRPSPVARAQVTRRAQRAPSVLSQDARRAHRMPVVRTDHPAPVTRHPSRAHKMPVVRTDHPSPRHPAHGTRHPAPGAHGTRHPAPGARAHVARRPGTPRTSPGTRRARTRCPSPGTLCTSSHRVGGVRCAGWLGRKTSFPYGVKK